MTMGKITLYEAHAGRGKCCILWDPVGHHIITASSSEICIHDPLSPLVNIKILHHHGVSNLAITNSLWLAPRSICLASASIDHVVKICKFTGGKLKTTITECTSPVRAIDFNKCAALLAAASDDGNITLINTSDGSTERVFRGHKGSITGIAFDPQGKYLASVDSIGTVMLRELTGGAVRKRTGIAPDSAFDPFVVNMLCWSPNGDMLAVPGLKNDVVIYDRITFEKLFSYNCYHVQPICFFCWSPNGRYIATSSVEKVVLIWDVFNKKDICRLKFDYCICSMAWKPCGTDLAIIDEMGKYGIWEDAIPSSMIRPTEDIRKEWEEEEEPCPPFDHGKHGSKSTIFSASVKMQEPFQPGATPKKPGKSNFLCYNMLGCVTTVDHERYSHIEIEFHDTGCGSSVRTMTDYFGFTMASLSDTGIVFANPSKHEKNTSTLMFYPFSGSTKWSIRLEEEEEIRAVALGNTWVAAATSLNFLHIFTENGHQRYIISLDGPVVTLVGLKDELAVVTHCVPSLPSDEQMLEFRVLNIHNAAQKFRAQLPLTPGSYLTWFGFSEEGQLSAFDSKGFLRAFTNQYGGSWVPLFRASKLKLDENYWVVGLNASKLFCVVCKSPDIFPQATPKPVLTSLDLSFPLAAADLGAENLENENMHLSQIQNRIEAAAASGQDTSSLDDEAFNIEDALHKCIL